MDRGICFEECQSARSSEAVGTDDEEFGAIGMKGEGESGASTRFGKGSGGGGSGRREWNKGAGLSEGCVYVLIVRLSAETDPVISSDYIAGTLLLTSLPDESTSLSADRLIRALRLAGVDEPDLRAVLTPLTPFERECECECSSLHSL